MTGAKDTVPHNGSSTISRVIGAVFLASLAGRILLGVDLTDEMQYYFQILALVETDSLFSNDLYIQQIVYVLVYPFAKIWVMAFGDAGLILFGRTLLALCLIALFWFTRARLEALGVDRVTSALTALSLSFAVTYHGIFALSYNTVSQMGWIVFVFLCLTPGRVRSITWALTIVITTLAHPVAGVAMAIIFACLCLMTKNRRQFFRTIGTTVSLAALLALLLLWFTDVPSLQSSLAFSAGFSVGSLFNRTGALEGIAKIVVLMLLAAFLPAPRIFARGLIVLLILLLPYFLYQAIASSLDALAGNRWALGYTLQLAQWWALLGILATYTARCVAPPPAEKERQLKIITLVTLASFIVLAGTSSNGIRQSVGTFSILLPLGAAFILVNAHDMTPRWAVVSKTPAFMIGLIALTFWQLFPYRDFPTFMSGRQSADFQIAKGLWISDRMVPIVTTVSENIGPLTAEKPGMILSRQPGLYAILNVHPETCMIYNHRTGSAQSEKILRDCLQTKTPAFVLSLKDARQNAGTERVHQVALDTAAQQGFHCETTDIAMPADYPDITAPVTYTFCN